MAEEPAYIVKLRLYAKGPQTSEDLDKLELEMYGANDRAAIVVFGSVTEDALLEMIKVYMRQGLNSRDRKSLFGFEGLAGTFSTKITLAYAMQWIGPNTRHDLDLIRALRNHAAHSMSPIEFSVPEIQAVCAELRTPDAVDAILRLGPSPLALAHALTPDGPAKTAKERFFSTCHTLSSKMMDASLGPIMSSMLGIGPGSFP